VSAISEKNLEKEIQNYKFCKIDWIAELWGLTEIVTLDYIKELNRLSIHIDRFRVLTFFKSFEYIYKDLSNFLWYVPLSKDELSKLISTQSVLQVRESHLRTKTVYKIISDVVSSLLFPNILKELEDVDLKYEIEFAKKEWMRESNEQVYPIQNKKDIAIQKKNASELKTFNHLQDIIDKIINGARTVTKVADDLGVSRITIHRRLNEANTSFQRLLSSVTSVT